MTRRPLPENLVLRPEEEEDAPDVEALYDVVFGPGRHAKGSARIREGVAHDRAVSFVADRNGLVIGAIRQTRVSVGGAPAYLLGPLAVAETAAKQGIGRALLTRSVDAARLTGADGIVLVGDPPFYAPSGFSGAMEAIGFPVPVEAHRLQSLALRAPLAGTLRVGGW